MQPKFPLQRIDQVCVVVDDLEQYCARYWQLFGIGPWKIWTYGPHMIKEMTYRGRPADFSMKVAIANLGQFMYEIIQPLAGESIYSDFLAAHGPGLQHVAAVVDDLDAAVEALRKEGYAVLMSGRGHGLHGDGAFAYLGTEQDLATVFEFIQPPRERRPPDAVYPA